MRTAALWLRSLTVTRPVRPRSSRCERDGEEIGVDPSPRFVTAHLEVDYVLPTPLGTMHLSGRLVELTGRKALVATELSVDGVVTAKGSAVLVEIPVDRWESPG